MATPAAASPPSPPEATQAPSATPQPAQKGPSLSPNAPPFFPAEISGRSKAKRWSSESDYSDDETIESLNAVLRGSPAPVDSGAGSHSQPRAGADAEQPKELASPSQIQA